MLNPDTTFAGPTETLAAGLGGTLNAARALAARIAELPRADRSLDLRLARALALDIVDLLERVEEPDLAR
jgi:hypothetical protein